MMDSKNKKDWKLGLKTLFEGFFESLDLRDSLKR